MITPRDMLDMLRRKGGARCTEVGRQIQSFLDGDLDGATATKVSNHLDACRRCGLAASDYRRLKAALAETATPVPAGSLERLRTLAAELAGGDRRP